MKDPFSKKFYFILQEENSALYPEKMILYFPLHFSLLWGEHGTGGSFRTIPSEKWAYETYLLYLLEEGSRDVMMSLPKEERF